MSSDVLRPQQLVSLSQLWMKTIIIMARILLLPLLFYTNSAFNLDTQAPIIKVGGAYQDSYFGYSVAQHVNKYGDPSIIVGAPRDKNLQPGTARSGAIYRCGVSLRTRDCVQVETDGRRHNQGATDTIIN